MAHEVNWLTKLLDDIEYYFNFTLYIIITKRPAFGGFTITTKAGA
jgi:hypothetical protein